MKTKGKSTKSRRKSALALAHCSALSHAIADKLNAAFNLYAWEDSKAEAAQIVADGIRELERENTLLRKALERRHKEQSYPMPQYVREALGLPNKQI